MARRTKITTGPYNPGMNPFARQPDMRFGSEWKLGDPGAQYEFNVKIMRLPSNASEGEWEHEVRAALARFHVELLKKYPWVGNVGFSGRSGGWLMIEDPKGKMTKPKLFAIGQMVSEALEAFKKHMVRRYPRRGG